MSGSVRLSPRHNHKKMSRAVILCLALLACACSALDLNLDNGAWEIQVLSTANVPRVLFWTKNTATHIFTLEFKYLREVKASKLRLNGADLDLSTVNDWTVSGPVVVPGGRTWTLNSNGGGKGLFTNLRITGTFPDAGILGQGDVSMPFNISITGFTWTDVTNRLALSTRFSSTSAVASTNDQKSSISVTNTPAYLSCTASATDVTALLPVKAELVSTDAKDSDSADFVDSEDGADFVWFVYNHFTSALAHDGLLGIAEEDIKNYFV